MADLPTYLVLACEDDRCRTMTTFADPHHRDAAPAAARARLAATLAELATRLRDRGAVGRLVLLNRDTGEIVARRRVWP
jgi:hypothetical protein